MAGPRALNRSDLAEMEGEHISNLRSPKELEQDHDGKVLDFEAGKIRHELLERMNREKGVISEDERGAWEKKLSDAYQDTSRLRAIKDEFEDLWKQSLEMHRKFDTRVHGAEDERLLRRGEHEALDEQFTQSGLEQKKRLLETLEKELDERHKTLGRFLKIEKDVQQKRRDELSHAEDYDEKLKILEEAEHENEHLQEYRTLFEKSGDALSNKTKKEYYEWFLTLSINDQHKAIDKAEKDDIGPRVEAWEIHQSLPKDYQSPDFKNWGLSRRLNYLGDLERRVDREWSRATQESKNVLSEKSLKVIEKEFVKPTPDTGKRLNRKISFRSMLEAQVDQEKKLWKEFDKLPDRVYTWLKDAFAEGDFEERTELLRTKAPQLIERYTKALNRMNNKLDGTTSELYREAFDSASSIEALEATVKEAETFQASKNRYLKKFKANEKYFRSDISVYENWYNETVRNVDEARHWEREMDTLVADHKKVYEKTMKLPPFLRERMDMDAPFDERATQAETLTRTAEAYRSTIPFLIKTAEAQEAKGDLNQALKCYVEALKLDPDSDELKQLAARTKQQGAKATGTSVSEIDEERTEMILEQIEKSDSISAEAAELARQRILLDLAKKHAEHIGASGTTTEARARASMRQFETEDRVNAETILKQHGDEFTVDEKGTVRQKIKVQTDGTRTQRVQDQLGALFDNKVHKGEAAQSGLSEVAFVNAAGQEMERTTAEKETDALHDRLEDRIRTLAMGRIKAANVKFSPQQMKAIEDALDFHSRTESLEKDAREAA